MPQTPQKRGRPSKYASKEEKAREDVIKKRARRRLQSTAARRDIRFQFYNTGQIQAVAPLPVHQVHLQSSNGLNVLTDAATSL
jgi:membrane carboxypeptidase/penicillin-binding protein PbpC